MGNSLIDVTLAEIAKRYQPEPSRRMKTNRPEEWGRMVALEKEINRTALERDEGAQKRPWRGTRHLFWGSDKVWEVLRVWQSEAGKKKRLWPSWRREPSEASEVSGIPQATMFRWLQEPDFRREYQQARGRVLELAIARIQKACGEAVQVLLTIMNDNTLSTSPRVSAAKAVLDMAIKGVEVEDLRSRIGALEEKVKGRNLKDE